MVTFFAFWPDPTTQRLLALHAKRLALNHGGRPTPANRVHLTLIYLGETSPGQLASLNALKMGDIGAFVLTLDRTHFWKHNKIIWAGAGDIPETMLNLHTQLATTTRRLGFSLEDRPFAPHVTLLRSARANPTTNVIEAIHWHVDEVFLVRSDFNPSRYSILRSWPLVSMAGAT